MRKLPYLFLGLTATFTGCNMPRLIQTNIPVYPTRPLHVQETDNILVGNIYNVETESYRENKEKLFIKLIASSVEDISYVLQNNCPAEVTKIQDRILIGSTSDSSLSKVNDRFGTTHAILVTSYNAYFDQTDVEVVRDEEGKSKTASYDIVVDTRYQFWKADQLQFDTLITIRQYHSSRGVLSGLLAAGPNIVTNEDLARARTRDNVDLYMRAFFERSESRMRPLYVKKEFENVEAAINRFDYEAAFQESEKLISSNNSQIKSKGYYNCAVLLEQKGEYTKARLYLEEALKAYPLPDARNMMMDYARRPR